MPYLAGGAVKECPQNVPFRHGDPWQWDYEDGCGGYGYNLTYLGSRLGTGEPFDRACLQSARSTDLRKPSQTLMFADTAMAKRQHGMPYYLEYSFAEPPFFLDHQGLPVNGFYASPSIHFRHRDCANIGWADGHVDSRPMAPFDQKNVYGVKSADMMLGWPEPLDNSLFDLK
ncbi:MAG: hypothetical protein AMJ79_00180 [Phycisphaerae bacterium SM23_30]|nr:MAG: hypothetical protein AMJ79_00180 [Phycisphaerae bacterium SM23_30]